MRLVILVLANLLLWLHLPAQAQFDFNPLQRPIPKKDASAQLDRKPTLDDIFVRTEFDVNYLPPLNLAGLKMPGLITAALPLLGQNYFVVVNDTKPRSFADIYKENRSLNRPNFVTVDSFAHTVFAHYNSVVALVIEKRLRPQLLSLLQAILNSSCNDYNTTEDVQMRQDIDRNLAFLEVAIKLLSPEAKLPEKLHVSDMVASDLSRIESETPAYSAVFKRQEDFSMYHPLGWYAATPELSNYYRCRQWLGRTYLLLSDITDEAGMGTGNEFRRAVLLFRSLSHAKFGESTGMKAWLNITKTMATIEPCASAATDGVLSPADFENAFGASEQDFTTTLEALSNPLSRARLFLTLKGKERQELGAKSVFELSRQKGHEHERRSFRLFPSIAQPEVDWLARQIVHHKDASEGFSYMPIGLFFLHARGFRAATNILADNTWRFDESLALALADLTKIEGTPNKAVSLSNPTRTMWQLYSDYAESKPPSNQSPLRTAAWLNCCLESVIASWVDSLTTIDTGSLSQAPKPTINSPKDAPANPEPVAKASEAPANQPPGKTSRYHVLEPCPNTYHALASYVDELECALSQLGLFPEQLRSRNQDFSRLAKRFTEIAKRELAGKTLDASDLALLSNIDQIYERVSFPAQGQLHLAYGRVQSKAPTKKPSAAGAEAIQPGDNLAEGFELGKKNLGKESSPTDGMNLALGGPAVVEAIVQGSHGPLLARGAVFAYYEIPGSALSDAQLSRKLQYGFLKPPFWCEPFQIMKSGAAH